MRFLKSAEFLRIVSAGVGAVAFLVDQLKAEAGRVARQVNDGVGKECAAVMRRARTALAADM